MSLKTNLSQWLIISVIITISWGLPSCREIDEVVPASDNLPVTEKNVVKLGKQLKNPYSVKNMQQAWENVQASNSRGRMENMDITATHYYIKFTPRTEEEFNRLSSDTTLILYEYPLDHEIEIPGDYYRDPDTPDSQPTPQYCAVTIDHRLPAVPYEILEELFIPDDYSDEATDRSRVASEEVIDQLVYEAMKLTDNLEEEETDNADPRARLCLFGSCKPKWRPAGRITVWDNHAVRTVYEITGYRNEQTVFTPPCYEPDGNGNYADCPPPEIRTIRVPIKTQRTRTGNFVGVEGVRVEARRWFTVHQGWTDANGRYSCDGRFKNPANYRITWDRTHFSIRSGTFGQAKLNGPKKTGNWDVNLGRQGAATVNDRQQYYALIHQAAYDYYYGSRFGLASPPRNGTFKPQTKIAANVTARQNRKRSHAAIYARTGGIFPSIYIREWNKSADVVYAVTTHELAHYAHWDMDRGAFRKLARDAYNINLNRQGRQKDSEAVIESWATGVEWQFAMARYRDRFGDSDYRYENNMQRKKIAPFGTGDYHLVYTSIVVDMIDNCSQRDPCNPFRTTGNARQFPQDRVSGYTIRQIEQGLRGARSWNAWRDNMRTRHNNRTENRINELFANWY